MKNYCHLSKKRYDLELQIKPTMLVSNLPSFYVLLTLHPCIIFFK